MDAGSLVACCLVLVGDFVLTLVEGSRVLGRGRIVDVSSVWSEDVFCVMEFESGEADSCDCNWIFWFATEEEKNGFLDVMSTLWEDLFKVGFYISLYVLLLRGCLRHLIFLTLCNKPATSY